MSGSRLALGAIAALQLVFAAGGMAAAGYFAAPKHHYEVRRDLSVYFTNSDRVIEDVRAALKARKPSFVISFSSSRDSMEDIPEITEELMTYALSETGEPDEGDYIFYQYGGYELDFKSYELEEGFSYRITVTPDLYTTSAQEERVDRAVKEILRSLPADRSSTDMEKLGAVRDWMDENVRYDRAAAASGSNTLKATAYAALVQHSAVCQGISVAACRLLRELGLEARVVSGTAGREGRWEPHVWNRVRIDGAWYNIDLTWGGEEYFLKTDETFPDHRAGE